MWICYTGHWLLGVIFGTARRGLWGRNQLMPLLAVLNVTARNGPLLCGFNVPIEGLKVTQDHQEWRCLMDDNINDQLAWCVVAVLNVIARRLCEGV